MAVSDWVRELGTVVVYNVHPLKPARLRIRVLEKFKVQVSNDTTLSLTSSQAQLGFSQREGVI